MIPPFGGSDPNNNFDACGTDIRPKGLKPTIAIEYQLIDQTP